MLNVAIALLALSFHHHLFAHQKPLSTTVVRLEDLDLSNMTTGWGEVHKNQSVDRHRLSIAGREFPRGVGTHARSELTVILDGQAESFHSFVGIDDETNGQGQADFKVLVDGHVRADSGTVHAKEAAKELSVDLRGAKRVELLVTDVNGSIDYAHADWGDAYFVVQPGDLGPAARLKTVGAVIEPPMPIWHVDFNHLEIHGPLVIGCTPGHEFLYRIPRTGMGEIRFEAAGLPDSIKLDPETGILRGTAPDAGRYNVRLTARGSGDSAERNLTIVAGEHMLALTPPMGWNSWNVWAGAVNQDRVKAAADEFISSRLADFGYRYVNIDDTWEGARDAEGNITTNEKFPDMAELADYVHGKGLMLGIYSSPGPKTCAGFEASYKHELQDATTYAKWGIDYLKYDWCSYGNVPHPAGLEGYQLPYIVMREALDKAPRDIVYSLCQYGMGDVYKWGHTVVGGNLWRTTGDINDSWSSMSGIAFSHSVRSPFAGPGGWNDPDMLVVGKLGWGDHPRQTHLSGNEQITHISMWALLAAPLMIGCDLTQLDQFTKDVLMNPEVIDVDQDPKGSAATRRFKNGDSEVWARQLWDGSYAIGLCNLAPEAAEITTNFQRDLGIPAVKRVRDLWTRRNVAGHEIRFKAKVPAHGTVLLRVTP